MTLNNANLKVITFNYIRQMRYKAFFTVNFIILTILRRKLFLMELQKKVVRIVDLCKNVMK